MNIKTLYQTLVIVMALLCVGLGLAHGQIPCVATVSGDTQCFTLWAGQNTNAGSVCVTTDAIDLIVTYTTTGQWSIKEAQLWIGNNTTDLPQTKTGNPIPGQFPCKSGELANNVTTYTFSRPLTNPCINFSCPSTDVTYYMAAHAALQKGNDAGTYQTETGWSDGTPITSRGNWATISTFTLNCSCDQISEEVECETAFAKVQSSGQISSTCFDTLGFQRWGWTNGPFPVNISGTYTFDIWAGAGQCDTNKGMLAGTLTVEYDANSKIAKVIYHMNTGWYMNETHLYVDNTMLPQYRQGKSLVDTVSPGQYPNVHEDLEMQMTDDIYTVSLVNIVGAEFYVVAHAVTCHYVP